MSGFHAIPKSPLGHIAEPARGTWRRAADGAPADLLAAADYPIVAVCSNCGAAISLDRKLQMEWQHLRDGGGAR